MSGSATTSELRVTGFRARLGGMKVNRPANQFAEARRALHAGIAELFSIQEQMYLDLELEVPQEIQPGNWYVQDVDLNVGLVILNTRTAISFADLESPFEAGQRLHAQLSAEIHRRNEARDRREFAALSATFSGTPDTELNKTARFLELRSRFGE